MDQSRTRTAGGLMLALALVSSVGQVRGASRAHGTAAHAPLPPKHRLAAIAPQIPTPAAGLSLPALLPQTSPEDWAAWWQSPCRPPTRHHVTHVNGRRIELFREALLPGWHYPYTDQELEDALRALPPAWLVHLRSVRLTCHPEWDAMARTDGSRIEISYVVDDSRRAWGAVEDDSPEELRFGARLEAWGSARYVVWPSRDALRTYILRHILIHELGHQVAPPNLDPEADEAWAEAFAYRYYTPPAPQPIAAAR